MAQHTPGPWTEFRDEDSHDIIAADGTHVARVEPINGLDPRGEQDANAMMLAAGPVLLSALKDAQAWLCAITDSNQLTDADRALLLSIDAAIATATPTSDECETCANATETRCFPCDECGSIDEEA